jgi:glycosyltransferase involved in cell wall biosynthesis
MGTGLLQALYKTLGSASVGAVTAPATVSIILPTFNRLTFLRISIDSVFAQTFKDWELIIADDGSDPETLEYLATLEDLPRVTLIRMAHTGNPSAVRNAALREARGSYIGFLDSDDVWMPSKLETQLAAHFSFPDRRWSYTALARIDAAGEPMRDGLGLGWIPYDGAIFEKLLALEATVATPTVLIERSLLQEAGSFDEQQPFFEDYDLWLRLSLLSDVLVLDSPLVLVRNHTQHYSADRLRVYEARFRLLDKISSEAKTARLRAVLQLARANNALSLAFVSAIAGRRSNALKMLWRSRHCACRNRAWWPKAAVVVTRTVAPRWMRTRLREIRRHCHNQAGAQ